MPIIIIIALLEYSFFSQVISRGDTFMDGDIIWTMSRIPDPSSSCLCLRVQLLAGRRTAVKTNYQGNVALL